MKYHEFILPKHLTSGIPVSYICERKPKTIFNEQHTNDYGCKPNTGIASNLPHRELRLPLQRLDRHAGVQTEEHEHLSDDRQTNDEQP